jgi:hypothetical protein
MQREPTHGAADDFTAAQLLSLPVYVDTSARKSRRRWVLFALVVVICLLLACGWAGNWSCLFWPNPDVAGDEAAFKRKVAEALPLGSTRKQVEAWLEGQGISHEGEDILDGPGGKPIGIGTSTPYSKECLPGQFLLEFYFDSDGKLTEEYVRLLLPNW